LEELCCKLVPVETSSSREEDSGDASEASQSTDSGILPLLSEQLSPSEAEDAGTEMERLAIVAGIVAELAKIEPCRMSVASSPRWTSSVISHLVKGIGSPSLAAAAVCCRAVGNLCHDCGKLTKTFFGLWIRRVPTSNVVVTILNSNFLW
jgi:hypothetical protein